MSKNIILIGFMGTGKSTLGRYLAKRMGAKFIDMDVAIENDLGMSVADIFKRYGENYFRQQERELVKRLSAKSGMIIATGGGTVKNPANVADLKKNGVIFCLEASIDELVLRTSKPGVRPVLDKMDKGDRRKAIEELLEKRKNIYEKAADYHLDTTEWNEEGLACQIMQIMGETVVNVDLGQDSYDILISTEIDQRITDFMKQGKYSQKGLIISDSNVAPLYGKKVQDIMEKAGIKASLAVVPAGESSKALMSTEDIYTKCIEYGLDRKSPIIALGGGVVGDLTGFIAATYMRGVPFIQIPTSLLAQVDSSVGGKVAVNHKLGKNLIGAFYQPKAVFMDMDMLKTLPEREIYTGLGEIIKYGIIYDEKFFEFLENNVEDVLKLEKDKATRMIARSCEIKAMVVSKDEKESGLRAILNFGHTMGHAIEKNTNYTKYNHGEAVAIGMVCAARISVALGMIESSVADRIEKLIETLKLPTRAEECDLDTLYGAIFHDKKTVNGKVKWVLVDGGIGKVKIVDNVPEIVVKNAMKYCLK